jgi:hypothetical protein
MAARPKGMRRKSTARFTGEASACSYAPRSHPTGPDAASAFLECLTAWFFKRGLSQPCSSP